MNISVEELRNEARLFYPASFHTIPLSPITITEEKTSNVEPYPVRLIIEGTNLRRLAFSRDLVNKQTRALMRDYVKERHENQ